MIKILIAVVFGMAMGVAAGAFAEDKFARTLDGMMVSVVGGLDNDGRGHVLRMNTDGRVLADCER